jgi:3-oxoacyl-[acyl-carrier protein] reductase
MSRLAGKVAVVTGASRGIGAAIALRLAADGAAVAVNYTSSVKAAEDVVSQISTSGGRAAAIQADVSRAAEVKRLFETVQERHGRVDIVVNNAGVFDVAPLAEFSMNSYLHIFGINVQGTILVAAEALKHFPETGGRIINLSSVLATGVTPGAAVYGASKAAVEALTRYWALELGPRNITVNAVAPGLTETDMSSNVPPDGQKAIAARTPLGRLGRPEEIADAVAFLASDEARWVTGHVLTASGGLRS